MPSVRRKRSLSGAAAHVPGGDAVDSVISNEAPISLAGRIPESATLLADRDPPRRHAYEPLTRRMFWDFRKLEERLLEARYGVQG